VEPVDKKLLKSLDRLEGYNKGRCPAGYIFTPMKSMQKKMGFYMSGL